MDFHYNRYEVTNGANLKYQKAEVKKEEKEEPQKSVVPEKGPVKQEEVMTGREALANQNRAMVKSNQVSPNVNEPLRSEDELINGIHGGRGGDDGSAPVGNRGEEEPGPAKGGITIPENKEVSENLRAGETGEITFDELSDLSNQIWSKVQELLNEFQIDYNVTEFSNINDGLGHEENNRPYQEVLYNLGQQNISEDDITELRDLVLKFEDMMSNYHVMNPEEPLDKLKHPIFMGIAECILAPRGLY